MPIYEYRCKKGHTFEVMQRMIDDPMAECATCGASVQRVFHPVAVHFKGSGFYSTDYGKRKPGSSTDSKGESGSSDSDAGSSSSSNSKDGSKPSKKSETSSSSSSSSSSSKD